MRREMYEELERYEDEQECRYREEGGSRISVDPGRSVVGQLHFSVLMEVLNVACSTATFPG